MLSLEDDEVLLKILKLEVPLAFKEPTVPVVFVKEALLELLLKTESVATLIFPVF